MIKLIASDMDGTLLNSNHKIPQNNIELIKFAQKKWNRICSCYR